MVEDRYAITSQVHVRFDRCHADVEGHFKARQGIFGLQSAGAAVSLEVKTWRHGEMLFLERAHKKTSLNTGKVTQRGRNREEAVSEEGTRAVPILVDMPSMSHGARCLSSFLRQILTIFLLLLAGWPGLLFGQFRVPARGHLAGMSLFTPWSLLVP